MSNPTDTPTTRHPRTSPKPKLSLLTPGKSTPQPPVEPSLVSVQVPPTPTPTPITRVQESLTFLLSPTTSTRTPTSSSGNGTPMSSGYAKNEKSCCTMIVNEKLVPSKGTMFRPDGTFITKRQRRLMEKGPNGESWSWGQGEGNDDDDEDMTWV